MLNKFVPWDFDVSKIGKSSKPRSTTQEVRMMLPMSVQCSTCGEFMYRGKKFNSKKETVEGRDYLGIKIFRFYMKCVSCGAVFTICTDPKRGDYAAESGVTRNYEPWRDTDEQEEEYRNRKEEEEKVDAMKALENRTTASKRQMDILDGLEEIQAQNARASRVDIDDAMAAVAARHGATADVTGGGAGAGAGQGRAGPGETADLTASEAAEIEALAQQAFRSVRRVEDDESAAPPSAPSDAVPSKQAREAKLAELEAKARKAKLKQRFKVSRKRGRDGDRGGQAVEGEGAAPPAQLPRTDSASASKPKSVAGTSGSTGVKAGGSAPVATTTAVLGALAAYGSDSD